MREQQVTERRVCLIASAVVLALLCLVFLLWRHHQSQLTHRLSERSEAYQAVLSPLWARQATLQKDLSDLERRVSQVKQASSTPVNEQQANLKGSVAVLLTDIDASLVNTILPEMRSNHLTGMLALSEYYFPGTEGCMTDEQIHDLLEMGWTLAMTVGESTNIRAFYQRFTESGLPRPEAVYCTASAMADKRAIFRELGLTVLIRRSESMITDDASYFVQCLGSNESTAPQKLQDISVNQDFLMLTVGTIYDRDKCPDPAAMFGEIQRGIMDGRIQMLRPTSNNLEHCVVRSILNSGNDSQLKTLQINLGEQLEEVNQQILEAMAPGYDLQA